MLYLTERTTIRIIWKQPLTRTQLWSALALSRGITPESSPSMHCWISPSFSASNFDELLYVSHSDTLLSMRVLRWFARNTRLRHCSSSSESLRSNSTRSSTCPSSIIRRPSLTIDCRICWRVYISCWNF